MSNPIFPVIECPPVRPKKDTSCLSRLSMTEEEFDQLLLKQGILSALPTGLSHEVFESYTPVVVSGKPLSETILEERR